MKRWPKKIIAFLGIGGISFALIAELFHWLSLAGHIGGHTEQETVYTEKQPSFIIWDSAKGKDDTLSLERYSKLGSTTKTKARVVHLTQKVSYK